MSEPSSGYRHKIPSVDPEMEQAVNEAGHDPEAYTIARRELRRKQAEKYVSEQLARAQRRRSSRVRRAG